MVREREREDTAAPASALPALRSPDRFIAKILELKPKKQKGTAFFECRVELITNDDNSASTGGGASDTTGTGATPSAGTHSNTKAGATSAALDD